MKKIFLCLSMISLLQFHWCVRKRVEIKVDESIWKEVKKFETTPSTEELYQKGRAWMERFTPIGYKEAIRYFDKALDLDPKFYKAYAGLAISYALWAKDRKDIGLDNIKQWIKASFYVEKAKEFYPSDNSLKAMAMVYASKNFLTEREYADLFRWTQSPKRRADKDRVISYLKDIFLTNAFKRYSLKEAIEILKSVLSNNPNDIEALLFKWWIENPGFEESEDLKKVFKIRPDFVLPYFEIGLAKKRIGNMEEAEYWLKEALKRNPEHPRALSELGEVFLSRGDIDEAKDIFKRAISLDSELPQTHFILGSVCQELGEYEDALNHFRNAYILKPDMEEAFYQSSIILIEEKRWNDAVEVLNSLIEIHGGYEIFGYTFRALSKLMLGKMEEAEADCNQAIEINPKFAMPYFILGLISFKKEEWKEAKGRFLLSVGNDKEFADAHYLLGQTLIRLKMKKLAKEELKRARELFLLKISKIGKMIKEAQEKGRIKKAERLNREKNETQEKITHCEALLNAL